MVTTSFLILFLPYFMRYGGNRSTGRKPPPNPQSLSTFSHDPYCARMRIATGKDIIHILVQLHCAEDAFQEVTWILRLTSLIT